MLKIPLSISASYVNWSWWHSIRELFQNAIDAHDRGQVMNYSYNHEHQRLVIKNTGALLARETLVLGVTSKKDVSSQRGEFGEGYKLAMATLCRLGAKPKIYNGQEVWTPELSHSDVFNTEILYFKVDIEPKGNYALSFVIDGIPEEEWVLARSRLLFLGSVYPKNICLPEGNILLDKEYASKLYVKGIYVADLPDKYAFGFDLSKIRLDRDRQAPDVITLRKHVSALIIRAVEAGSLSADSVLDLLEAGGGEALAFEHDYSQPSDFHRKLSAAFDKKYGESAVPVGSMEESIRAQDFAMKGIVVNSAVLRALRKVKSSLDRILASKILEVSRVYSAHELSVIQMENLKWAVNLASTVEPIKMSNVSVVDFTGNKLWGKYETETGKIFLSSKVLLERKDLIATVIHEACHKYGLDGEISHRDAVEDRMGRLVVSLFDQKNVADIVIDINN